MTVLEVRGMSAGYHGIDVVHELDLEIGEGELVCVIGANGSGKTTLLRTVCGLMAPSRGTVRFRDRTIAGLRAPAVAALGIAHVPEGRRVFPLSTVEENLCLGAWVRHRDRRAVQDDLERLCEKFPILGERRRSPAGSLSGGQQQILALAMGLMARPELLLLDEPSLGLAPLMVAEMFEEIQRLKEEGTTILLVEQLAGEALAVADRGVVLQLGRVTLQGRSGELRQNKDVLAAYLG